jgi:hypothetical protein
MVEIAIGAGSAAAGRRLGTLAWTPVCVLHGRAVRDPAPDLTLRPVTASPCSRLSG